MTHILGVDPGYDRMGYAVIDDDLNIITCDVIQTDKRHSYWERLNTIYLAIVHIIDVYAIDVTGIEKPFTGKNVGSGTEVAGAWGVIGLAVYCGLSEYIELTNSQIKAAVARGGASKEEVRQGVAMILGLDALPKLDDATDALAAAICARDRWRLMEMEKAA